MNMVHGMGPAISGADKIAQHVCRGSSATILTDALGVMNLTLHNTTMEIGQTRVCLKNQPSCTSSLLSSVSTYMADWSTVIGGILEGLTGVLRQNSSCGCRNNICQNVVDIAESAIVASNDVSDFSQCCS